MQYRINYFSLSCVGFFYPLMDFKQNSSMKRLYLSMQYKMLV